jgi:hypothetical protein
LKISLAAESSAPFLGGGIWVGDKEERVAMMAEGVVAVRGQKVQIDDLMMNTGGRTTEATDSGIKGHGGGGREVAVAEKEMFLLSGRAQGEQSECKQAQFV